MKVVFLEDVTGVAQGGDVKDVKNGFARNYLIPQNLAMLATKDSVQRIERLKGESEVKRQQILNDMTSLGGEIDGVKIKVEMRAGASGRLYGSVKAMDVVSEIASLIGRDIDRRTIQISEPIRHVGLHSINVSLHAEVSAVVSLLVYPVGDDPDEFLAKWTAQQSETEAETEAEAEAEVEAETEAEVETEVETSEHTPNSISGDR